MKYIIMLALILLLTSCNSSDAINIGVIAPLTGDFASYGVDVHRGIEMAKEDINGKGGILGKNIEVIYEDACLPKDALSAANKLIDLNNIEFIAGSFCVIGTIPIMTITEPKKMSMMIIAPAPDNILDDAQYVFSMNVASRDEAIAQANYAYNVLDARTTSIIYIDTDLGISYSENFAKRFVELGGEILSNERLKIDEVDFRPDLTKIKQLNPDLVLSLHLGNQGGIILQQIGSLEIKSDVLSYYQGENPVVLEVAGKHAENFIISTTNKENKTPKQQEFAQRFLERYGVEASSVVASTAYDSLIVQAKVYEACRGKRECMKLQLHEIKDYEGVSGTFSIGPDGTAIKDFVFKQVKNGEFVTIYP